MLLLRVFLVAKLALQPVWLSAQALSSPESVRYDAANARFLISNRGGGGSV